MLNFPQVSSAWIVKIIKKDEVTLTRIAHNIDYGHEAVESFSVHLSKQAVSLTAIKIRPDCIFVDNNKFVTKTSCSEHKHEFQDIGHILVKVTLELGEQINYAIVCDQGMPETVRV